MFVIFYHLVVKQGAGYELRILTILKKHSDYKQMSLGWLIAIIFEYVDQEEAVCLPVCVDRACNGRLNIDPVVLDQ